MSTKPLRDLEYVARLQKQTSAIGVGGAATVVIYVHILYSQAVQMYLKFMFAMMTLYYAETTKYNTRSRITHLIVLVDGNVLFSVSHLSKYLLKKIECITLENETPV